MKTISLYIFLCSFTCLSSAHAARVTFNDLPQLIREKNEKVQAAETLTLAAKKRTGFLVRSFFPEVALRAGNETAKIGSANTENRDNWSANAQLNLYRGGRDSLEENIRETKVAASEAASIQDYQNELREARKVYAQMIANAKILTELSEAIKNNKDNIQSAKRRSGAGITTNADAVQFELDGTLLTQHQKKLSLEQEALKRKLAVMLSLENTQDLQLDPEFASPAETLAKSSSEDLVTPETEALKQEVAAINLQKDQSARWWIPSVDFYAAYRRPSLQESDTLALAKENEWATGIMLSLSLGEGLEKNAQSKAQALEAKALAHKLSYALRTAKGDFANLQNDLVLLGALIQAADQDVEKSASFLRLTKNEYNRGVKNGPDLQEAFNKHYEFKTRRIELHRLYSDAQADLAYQTSLQRSK